MQQIFAPIVVLNFIHVPCVGQRSRLIGVKTTPLVGGPSSDDFITTKESQRFPEMPALPPLVSINKPVLTLRG